MNTEELLLDLLSKKAVYGLSEAEQKQLDELSAPSGREDGSFELAAAAISMIDLKTDEPLPDHLRTKIMADAEKIVGGYARQQQQSARDFVFTEPKPSFWNFGNLGWAVAAVACVLLAVTLIINSIKPAQPEIDTVIVETLTPEQSREKLIASADVVKAAWVPGNMKDLKDISGDIVWSDSQQAGYMRFRGLPVNDKNKETYQLWIFDETQDEKTPIDGGTFDIQANGDVIIPVNAKLKAVRPKMFAITVEKPGGVVVSARVKIPALAKVET